MDNNIFETAPDLKISVKQVFNIQRTPELHLR